MYDAPTITALTSGQLVLRDYLVIHGWNDLGSPTDFVFWTGADNVTVNVKSAITGSTVSINAVGGGTLLDAPAIVDGIGLEVRGVEFGLSQLHSDVQDMVRGNTIRLAPVEFYRGVFSPATWALVSTPFPRFLGRVDTVHVETAQVGGEGNITLACSGDAIDLTRTSPALKSDETQRLRSGDRFRRYADSAAKITVSWGQKKGKAA